MIDRVE
jgi:hypothetical protein